MRVTKRDEGGRLDLFLKERVLKGSRKEAKRILDAGLVRVNGRKVIISSWQLKDGDEVAIADTPLPSVDPSRYFLKVVYEDDCILVVLKDAGIPCEESPASLKPSLVQIINSYFKYPKNYLGLVHRLDKDTSGLMVYTKKRVRLAEQFRTRSVDKRYLAVVDGKIAGSDGVITAGLAKGDFSKGKKVEVGTGGREAVTRFRVIERYRDATLVEVIPQTGRTHQIRVHLAHIGHPILGDKIYGRPAALRRQALHASFLGFRHPITGKKMTFKSVLPRDMRRLVKRLREGRLHGGSLDGGGAGCEISFDD